MSMRTLETLMKEVGTHRFQPLDVVRMHKVQAVVMELHVVFEKMGLKDECDLLHETFLSLYSREKEAEDEMDTKLLLMGLHTHESHANALERRWQDV